MKSMSLYENLSTPIHRREPLTKIMYVATVLVVPTLLGRIEALFACILLSIVNLIIGRVLRKTLPILGCSIIMIFTVILIQGLFRAENTIPVMHIGKLVFYQEGLIFSIRIGLNVINLLLAFSTLILTTKPSELIRALVKKGLSPKIGYVISSVFQIIPQMRSTMETISDAQRSRGMETEGKLLVRIKAFIPLIAPVVMNSLIATRERAIALEVRGFNCCNKKSFLNEQPPQAYDRKIRLLLWGIMFGSMIGRLIIWQH